jgi:hypothetical protein
MQFTGYAEEYAYVQFNYFFRVWMPSDGLLHGVPMANVIHRTMENWQRTPHILCSEWDSITRDPIYFIAGTDVFATALLVGPFDHEAMPIMKGGRNDSKVPSGCASYYSPHIKAHQLVLIDLHPHNSQLRYQSNCQHIYNEFEPIDTSL